MRDQTSANPFASGEEIKPQPGPSPHFVRAGTSVLRESPNPAATVGSGSTWLQEISAEICRHHREKTGDSELPEEISVRLFFYSLNRWFSERQREQAGMLDESFLQWLSDSEDMRTMVAVRGKGDVAAIPHAAHMVWMRSVTDKIREHYRSINPNQRIGKPSSSKLFFHEIARGGEKS